MTVTISGNAGIARPLGSAGSPSDVNTSDSTTGLYFPASNTVGISTGGTNALYIDASQNVGIGTTSPVAKLDVPAMIRGYGVYNNLTSGTINLYSGTAFNTGGAAIAIRGTSVGYNNGGIEFYTGAGATGSEVMRIDSSGNLLVGTTTQVGKLTVNGSIAATGSVGTYSLDTSSNQSTLANGGTINFSNFAGILIINNSISGSTYIYACGGGLVTSIGGTGTFQGNLAYNPGITGYTYTNNTGSTITIGIMALRARNAA